MSDDTSLSLDILATDDGVAVSPFLQATRVSRWMSERCPVSRSRLRSPCRGHRPAASRRGPTDGARAHHAVSHRYSREDTDDLPRAGLYRLSAVVSLFDPNSTPARYARVVSAPVTIRVTQ